MDELSIRLPPELKAELEARIDGTDFESLDEYVRFVLEEIVADDAAERVGRDRNNSDLEDRLEDLGYL
jgi:Arc/MetJ-type ribon-helix-helix transcriptional regulator